MRDFTNSNKNLTVLWLYGEYPTLHYTTTALLFSNSFEMAKNLEGIVREQLSQNEIFSLCIVMVSVAGQCFWRHPFCLHTIARCQRAKSLLLSCQSSKLDVCSRGSIESKTLPYAKEVFSRKYFISSIHMWCTTRVIDQLEPRFIQVWVGGGAAVDGSLTKERRGTFLKYLRWMLKENNKLTG